jgi:hypothetical protein
LSLHSLFTHASDINDLLEGLDGILEDWLDRLHDTESSFHIIDLWLHTFDGLHLSGDLNEWLSIIESLQDSSGKSFLDVLDSGGLGNSGGFIVSGFGGEGLVEGSLEGWDELWFTHGVEFGHVFSMGWDEGLVMVMVMSSGNDGGQKAEFHFWLFIFIINSVD